MAVLGSEIGETVKQKPLSSAQKRLLALSPNINEKLEPLKSDDEVVVLPINQPVFLNPNKLKHLGIDENLKLKFKKVNGSKFGSTALSSKSKIKKCKYKQMKLDMFSMNQPLKEFNSLENSLKSHMESLKKNSFSNISFTKMDIPQLSSEITKLHNPNSNEYFPFVRTISDSFMQNYKIISIGSYIHCKNCKCNQIQSNGRFLKSNAYFKNIIQKGLDVLSEANEELGSVSLDDNEIYRLKKAIDISNDSKNDNENENDCQELRSSRLYLYLSENPNSSNKNSFIAIGCLLVVPILKAYKAILANDCKLHNSEFQKSKDNQKQLDIMYSINKMGQNNKTIKKDKELDLKEIKIVDKENGNNNNVARNGAAILDMSNTNINAKLGVSRIWVHKDFRNQRIATKLLNASKKDFCDYHCCNNCKDSSLCNISNTFNSIKEQMAFSQPTSKGIVLAQKYFSDSKNGILVYI